MKITSSGKFELVNWYGLDCKVRVPKSWKVTIETVCWETWRLSVTTPNRVTKLFILKQIGKNPSMYLHKRLFTKRGWRAVYNNLNLEEEEK